jgi:hypothetical protein
MEFARVTFTRTNLQVRTLTEIDPPVGSGDVKYREFRTRDARLVRNNSHNYGQIGLVDLSFRARETGRVSLCRIRSNIHQFANKSDFDLLITKLVTGLTLPGPCEICDRGNIPVGGGSLAIAMRCAARDVTRKAKQG